MPKVDGDAIECTIGTYKVSASDAGVSIKRDGKDLVVYVARGLAILTSPGGRVEIGAGEQGIAKADQKPLVTSVAFWQDWTGGMGDQRGARAVSSGTGRLYGLDPSAATGSPARKLGIAKQAVRAVLRDGIAETEVDQVFSNPGSQPIEGWYWFTVPTTATVTGFALETNGVLVEGEVIEKREAAAQYGAAMRQGNDPALLEWVDGRTYRARVFPIPAIGTRRVVLRYMEMLPMVEGKTRYVYPLRSEDPVRFDEFSLAVDVGDPQDVEVASSLDARVEGGGRTVSMRRSGYVPQADFQLELVSKEKRAPVSAWRFQAGADQADYVMLRYAPNKDFAKEPPADADVVVVVDTSAGGDESARQLRIAAAEGALRALSDHDHFALVALDVAPTVVYPKEGQGWYPAAYRQFKTLTDLDTKSPLAWLRLANAAAGAGRVDEALRIDREVSGGEGTPGPNDPRMFARLLSASRLGLLLEKPDPAAGITTDAVSRKIKEFSLFSGPGTLSILTWDDLDAQLVIGAADEKSGSPPRPRTRARSASTRCSAPPSRGSVARTPRATAARSCSARSRSVSWSSPGTAEPSRSRPRRASSAPARSPRCSEVVARVARAGRGPRGEIAREARRLVSDSPVTLVSRTLLACDRDSRPRCSPPSCSSRAEAASRPRRPSHSRTMRASRRSVRSTPRTSPSSMPAR